jgi:hypothetical protein
MKFNRAIGRHAGECWTFTGEAVPRERYPDYLASALPTDEDRAILGDIFKEKNWIAPHVSRPDLDTHRQL